VWFFLLCGSLFSTVHFSLRFLPFSAPYSLRSSRSFRVRVRVFV
jgi:hypothetical protein